jgi:RNA polymerase sigma-70 factor (ECF subfamily)
VHIEPLDEQGMDDALDALFAADGHWQAPPPAWQEPERALQERQFLSMLQLCVDRLSPKLARIFMMREWLEREVDEICAELGITANNCHVMLYRARMALRECVDQRWFEGRR